MPYKNKEQKKEAKKKFKESADKVREEIKESKAMGLLDDDENIVTGKAGRPTNYSEELAIRICEALATSIRGVGFLHRTLDFFPTKKTILRWRREHPEFDTMYVQARTYKCELVADESIEVAYDESIDPIRARLISDNYKWYAGKHAKHLYGDKVQVDNTSSDGSMSPKYLSDEEINLKLKMLLEKKNDEG